MSDAGIVSVSVIAGPIKPTQLRMHAEIGKGINMGNNFSFHITPEIARQWITVLEPISKEDNK